MNSDSALAVRNWINSALYYSPGSKVSFRDAFELFHDSAYSNGFDRLSKSEFKQYVAEHFPVGTGDGNVICIGNVSLAPAQAYEYFVGRLGSLCLREIDNETAVPEVGKVAAGRRQFMPGQMATSYTVTPEDIAFLMKAKGVETQGVPQLIPITAEDGALSGLRAVFLSSPTEDTTAQCCCTGNDVTFEEIEHAPDDVSREIDVLRGMIHVRLEQATTPQGLLDHAAVLAELFNCVERLAELHVVTGS